MAKVFIGMPSYNSSRFIREAVESLRSQTFTDWTMLISDDASTDETEFICKEYAKKDPRITYYRQPKNIGQFDNFKFVLDKAKGEYFMWAGHDDLWDKDFIKVCVENLSVYPERGVSFTNHNAIHANTSIAIEYPNFPNLSGPKNLHTVIKFVLEPEVLGKPNVFYSLFRLDCARKAFSYYPHQKKWGADILFSLAAISHCGIIIDKRVLFNKRLGGYSSSGKNTPTLGENNIIKNPKNYIFPIGGGRFSTYMAGHRQALRDTPYYPFVFVILLIRSVRALVLHLKTRNYRKYLEKIK